MEMHDLGKVSEGISTVPSEGTEGKKEKYYPSIDLTSTQLPALSNKKIGSGVSLHLVGKIKGIREQKEKDKTEVRYEIELRQAGEMGVSKDEYMDMSDDDKDKKDAKDVQPANSEE